MEGVFVNTLLIVHKLRGSPFCPLDVVEGLRDEFGKVRIVVQVSDYCWVLE